MPNVLILGGTKFFGALLADKLHSHHHHVIVVSRIRELPDFIAQKVTYIHQDIQSNNDEEVEKTINFIKDLLLNNNINIVIDNISFLPNQVNTIFKGIQAAERSIEQYILCSSVAVYNDWNKGYPVTQWPAFALAESSVDLKRRGYQPMLFAPSFTPFYELYANGKRSAEQELISWHHKLNIPYTIIRPAVIEGKNDPHHRTWYWAQRLLDGEPVLFPHTEPPTVYRHVYVNDVAEAFFSAVNNKLAYNQTFNIAGEEVLSAEDYLRGLAKALNITDQDVCLVPTKPDIISTIIPNFEFPPFFSGVALIPSINKAKEVLGYQPTPFETWIRQIAHEIKENKSLKNSLGYELRKEEVSYANTQRDAVSQLSFR